MIFADSTSTDVEFSSCCAKKGSDQLVCFYRLACTRITRSQLKGDVAPGGGILTATVRFKSESGSEKAVFVSKFFWETK